MLSITAMLCLCDDIITQETLDTQMTLWSFSVLGGSISFFLLSFYYYYYHHYHYYYFLTFSTAGLSIL